MEGTVVGRVIDSDHSCLFNAVGYVIDHDKKKASELIQEKNYDGRRFDALAVSFSLRSSLSSLPMSTFKNLATGKTWTCKRAVLEAKVKRRNGEEEREELKRDLEQESSAIGAYSASLKKHYLLAGDERKESIMPEIMGGQNVYDFVHQGILQRFEELEQEEGLRCVEDGDDIDIKESHEENKEEQKTLTEILKKKSC